MVGGGKPDGEAPVAIIDIGKRDAFFCLDGIYIAEGVAINLRLMLKFTVSLIEVCMS